MEEFTITRDDDTDLRFTGECLAKVSWNDSDFTGHDLTLYQTQGASPKYVCHSLHWSNVGNGYRRNTATVAITLEAVFAFFGAEHPAKRLYEKAGIDFVEIVA